MSQLNVLENATKKLEGDFKRQKQTIDQLRNVVFEPSLKLGGGAEQR